MVFNCNNTGMCLAQGSKVYTPNGHKNVNDLNSGDILLTIDGTTKVADVIMGFEETVIRITSDKGKSITTTLNHPFLKEDNKFIKAETLKVGDIVRTSDGTETIKEILIIEGYNDRVYSIIIDAEDKSIIVDGFYVGDFSAQNRMPRAESIGQDNIKGLPESLSNELEEFLKTYAKDHNN